MFTIALLLIALAGSGFLSPAEAAARECGLYDGPSQLEMLKSQEMRFLNKIKTAPGSIQSYCQLSHIHYKIAANLKENLRDREYSKCIDFADAAIARNPKAGAAYFIKALCMGKRGELNGIWESLSMIKDFETLMKTAANLDPGLDYGGPHRALGRYYFKLPRLLGGSVDEAISQLEIAMTYGPDYWENLLYLGEAYFEDDRYKKAQNLLSRFIQISQTMPENPEMTRFRNHARGILNEIKGKIGSL